MLMRFAQNLRNGRRQGRYALGDDDARYENAMDPQVLEDLGKVRGLTQKPVIDASADQYGSNCCRSVGEFIHCELNSCQTAETKSVSRLEAHDDHGLAGNRIGFFSTCKLPRTFAVGVLDAREYTRRLEAEREP